MNSNSDSGSSGFFLFKNGPLFDSDDSSPSSDGVANPKTPSTPTTPFSFVRPQYPFFSTSGGSSRSNSSPSNLRTPDLRSPNFSTPNFRTPNLREQNLRTPDSQSPFFSGPNFRTPNLLTSNLRTPNSRSSDLRTPGTKSTPNLRTPDFRSPNFSTPNFRTPNLRAQNLRTPGTKSTSTVTTGGGVPKPSFIVAIVEGRGLAKGEIGFASMDIRHPELCLSQFSDSGNYAKLRVKLQILNPTEIIVPDSAVERGGNMLALLGSLQQEFPKMKVTPVKRRYFNEGQGIELINRIKTDDCMTIEKDIRDKYYGLACGSALIRHIEYIQNIVFAARSVKVVYKGIEKTCMIDPGTAKHLELIVNLQDVTDTDRSLCGVINHTFTHGGARMMRASLLQPPADLTLINLRLDAITELKSDIPQFHALRSLISRMLDVDHLVALCSHLNREETARSAEYKITQTICLKHTLELVEPLRESLSSYSNPLFKSFHDMLIDDRFQEILDKIGGTLREETRYEKNALNMLSQKCFAVKPNLNGFLDLARRTYSELIQDVEELCSDVVEETGLPLAIAYASGRDFYLQMRLKDGQPLPAQFDASCLINMVRKAHTVSCTTRNLVKLNDRITQTVNEIFSMSNAIVAELLAEIRNSITCLYNLTEVISTVDFICSLTLFCASCPGGFVRPEFSDTLAISQGRHPLLEKSCEEPTYYPNDVYAGPESNVVIITGPNMGGKSTYLKLVAVLQVLAQMGSYVPANYASFRLTDQIFSRIGQNDDLENNCSAFMLEMKDVNYILQNIGENSLIIMDELARSTSPEEGTGICHAIAEFLINSDAFVFFATHFLELTSLDSMYPNVENYHFEGQENAADGTSGLVVNHTLKRGPYRGPSYGFEVAKLASMPPEVIERAKLMVEELRSRNRISAREEASLNKERAVMRLAYRLMHAAHKTDMEANKFVEYLKHLKARYNNDLQAASDTSMNSYGSSLATSQSSETAPSSSGTSSF